MSDAYAANDDQADFEEDDVSVAGNLRQLIDHPNIAELLEPEVLASLGQKVWREYEVDERSREKWRTRLDKAMDIAMQVTKPKDFPWPEAANVKFPLMAKAAIHFNANAYPAIVPDAEIVKGRVIGEDKGQPKLDEQGQPRQQQVGEDPETGEPIMEPVWKVEPGAKRARAERVATHMSWQLTEEMPEWEEETDRLLVILPIVGCVFRKTYYDDSKGRSVSELGMPGDVVVNYHARSLESAARITHIIERLPHEIEERKRNGTYLKDVELGLPDGADQDDDQAPHQFLEQCRLYDLDEDGYPEPYVVTVHKDTKKVVRIVARFDEDGMTTDVDGRILKIEPIHYWTKYGFIPSPDGGFYDQGFGTLMQPLNEVVNSTLNQLLDAGTAQNAGGGFISANMQQTGKVRFKPNEYKILRGVTGKMSDNIWRNEHSGPSAVLYSLLGTLIDAAEDLASVKDIMTGEAPDSQMPATLGLALIERGMKVFSAIYKRIHRSLKSELKKLYRLNALYLGEQVYVAVLDDTVAVGRADYETTDFDIVPVSDPTIVTDMQRLGRAEFLMQFINDPLVDPVEARRRIFDAATIDDAEKLLLQEAPPNPELVAMADKQELEVGKLELEESKVAIAKMEAQIKGLLAAAEMESKGADTDLKMAQTAKVLAETEEIEEGDDDNDQR